MTNFVNVHGVDPKRDADVYLPLGQGAMAWIDPRDVGEAAAAALCDPVHDGHAYTLTGPQALTAADALAILGDAFGRRYRYVDVPPSAAQEAMEAAGLPLWLVDGLLQLHALVRDGGAAGTTGDVQAVLGRPPRTLRQWAEAHAGR